MKRESVVSSRAGERVENLVVVELEGSGDQSPPSIREGSSGGQFPQEDKVRRSVVGHPM